MSKRKQETKEQFNLRIREYYNKRKLASNNLCKDCGKIKSYRSIKSKYCILCNTKGKRCPLIYLKRTKAWKKNISKAKLNEKNPMWKGDSVGLIALHGWIKRNKPKPQFCEDCKVKPPIDLANISQKYKRDINDFEWLCRKCHMVKDGRLIKLIYAAKK